MLSAADTLQCNQCKRETPLEEFTERQELLWCVRCLGEAELSILMYRGKPKVVHEIPEPPKKIRNDAEMQKFFEIVYVLLIEKFNGKPTKMGALMYAINQKPAVNFIKPFLMQSYLLERL